MHLTGVRGTGAWWAGFQGIERRQPGASWEGSGGRRGRDVCKFSCSPEAEFSAESEAGGTVLAGCGASI